MRFVNRKRLVVVVLIAAVFGAVLPYVLYALEDWFPTKRGSYDWPSAEYSMYMAGAGLNIAAEDRFVLWYGQKPTEEARVRMLADLKGHVPSDIAEVWSRENGGVTINEIGWPLRAFHGCDVMDLSGNPQATSTSWKMGATGWAWADRKMQRVLPTGVLWWGLFGDVALVVAIAAGVYCGQAYWRGSRRVKRGMCWKCGYLSKGAAMCPECGAVSPAS